jgi:hypothetical protein
LAGYVSIGITGQCTQFEEPSLWAALARLRNRDGGYRMIGFDDKIGRPDPNRLANAHDLIHRDKMQAIVSWFASSRSG